MKNHLRTIKKNVPESAPDENAEDGAKKDKVSYLSFRKRPITFPGEPFQEEKRGDKSSQIGRAIPTDANISIESEQKWIEMMNVEREPHRRHERSGPAKEFKEMGSRTVLGFRFKVRCSMSNPPGAPEPRKKRVNTEAAT
jgi:hypothetical protein